MGVPAHFAENGKSAEKIFFFCYGKINGKKFSGKNFKIFLLRKLKYSVKN